MAIYSYCGSQQREVASLTKIMTCLCCLYLAEKHHISLSTTRTSISKHCSSMEGTSAGLKQADSITLNDLLYAMMLPSGNDAAEALAQYFGEVAWRDTQERKRKNKAEVHKAESTKLDNKMGEKEAFKSKELSQKIVKQWEYTATTDSDRHCNVYLSAQCSVSTFIGCMNHLSQHLHLLNTQFANCHGLADCRNRSTSNDLSELSYHAMKNVRFKEIVTTRTYECSVFNKYAGMARLMRWNNTNKLLDLEYCEGIKTGHTSVAGACMAAYFSGDEELEVIIVTLKAKSKSTRFEEVRRLY